MPVFTPQDIKEIEVANRIKAVLLSTHIELGKPLPKKKLQQVITLKLAN